MFINFRRGANALDLSDRKKWAQDGAHYKLVSSDREADRLTFDGTLSAVKEFKADQKLVIAGMANANITDRSRERLDPRGLDVASYVKNPVLLSDHNYAKPIGQVVELDIQDDGVHFRAWIGDPAAGPMTMVQAETRSLVAQRVLRTVSVGFIPKKIKAPIYDDRGTLVEPLVIVEWELLELSVVAVPCNQDSVFEVKQVGAKDMAKIKTVAAEPEAGAGTPAAAAEAPAAAAAEPAPAAPAQKDAAQEEAAAGETEAFQGKVLTLLSSQAEVNKKVADTCDAILKKLEEKPGAEDDKPEGKPVLSEDDEKAAASEAETLKSVIDRLDSLDELVGKVCGTVAKLADMIRAK